MIMQNLKRIQSAIAEAEMQALLLIDPKNRYYACGFPSSDGVVLVTSEKAYVIIDARYIEACRAAIGDSAEVLLCDRRTRPASFSSSCSTSTTSPRSARRTAA